MYKASTRRMISLLLCAVMLLGNLPVVSFAASDDGLCEHHTEHIDCGYVEGEAGCGYECELCAQIPEATDATEAIHNALETVVETVSIQITSDTDLPENEELFAGFVRKKLYGDEAFLGVAARERLTAAEQGIYDALKAKIETVATSGGSTSLIISDISGIKTTWTNTELGVPSIEDTSSIESAFIEQFGLDKIVNALLADCPFDLYWFDKTEGVGVGYQVGLSGYNDGTQDVWTSAAIMNLTFVFPVSADYQSGGNVVTNEVSKIAAARNNAAQVVTNCADKSDYEKLIAYRDYICEVVEYNSAAVGTSYGDPWQLISVFDGDSSTDVVCEGYSKAFMYLCDLTSFDGDVTCYTVSGRMGDGDHMWNIVTLEDANYLVDVTNSDAGTIGQDGGLFLVGADGSAKTGYTFLEVPYTYDSETLSLWGTGDDSILKLSNENYVPETEDEPEIDNIIASGECGDNLTWTLDDAGTLTITGTGDMWFFYDNTRPWIEYLGTIKNVSVESGVTSICDSAFHLCRNMVGITIPDSVTSIGRWTFQDCSSLTGITIPDGVTSIGCGAFENCSNLTEITIPDGVTVIDYHTFMGCSSLANITIPDGVTTIGNDAFSGCSSLTRITIPDSVKSMGARMFQNCSSLSEIATRNGILSIGEFMFSGCRNLSEIKIHNNVTHIGDGAFSGCFSLTEIEIPDGVMSIGNAAFQSCSGLTGITIPDGVKSIGYSTFFGCSSLSKITIPDSVTSIGNMAFHSCISLNEIEIPDGVTSIGSKVFYGCSNLIEIKLPKGITSIVENTFDSCSSLTKIVIPDGVRSIDRWAFQNCYDLSEITLPDSLTSIGYQAFRNCYDLTEMEIPDSVIRIDSDAFYNCTGLTKVTIPDSVTSIGGWTFYNCTSLTEITIPDSVTRIDKSAFYNCSSLQDVYYGGTVEEWENLGEYRPTAKWIHFSCTDPANHWETKTTATCTEAGYSSETCACGYTRNEIETPALGHTYENGVCSRCGDTLGTVKHKQWTMSLDSVAFLNYYVNLTGFADDVDFAKQGGVVIWTGSVAPTKANQLQVGLENCKTIEGMLQNDNGWYIRSHEIFAKNLGDMVYMRPYVEVSEGVYVYGPAKGYSPHRYCLDMVGNENERLDTRRLCAALLEYGAAAQLYFDHNEDNLVNKGMNLQEEYGLAYDSSYLNGLNVTDHARSLVSTLDGVKTGVSYKKATLNLQGAIRMSVGYNIDASIIDWTEVEKAEVLFWTEARIAGIDSLAYELHNYTYSHELRPKNAEDTVELGDYRSISDHIQAKDLGKTMFYCCRIVMKDGTVYRSGLNAYSPEAFLGDHLKTATGEIGDLCKKIAVYGEMARQRFS